jgi:DnaD/phage-associated family protein
MTAPDANTLHDSPISEARLCIPAGYVDAFLMTSTNLDEQLVLLACFRLLGSSNETTAIPEEILLADPALNQALISSTSSHTPTSRILRAINRAVRRGALVRQWIAEEDRQVTRYAIPTEIPVPGGERPVESPFDPAPATASPATAPSVFAAYEDNIGMLTPLIADQIQRAIELYPPTWIREAIQEAVFSNKRQWRYVQRVLQNWATEGRDSRQASEVSDETHQRGPAEPLNTDQYREGRHLERARKLQL